MASQDRVSRLDEYEGGRERKTRKIGKGVNKIKNVLNW